MPFEILATVAAGVFTGAAIYISFVEHAARIACGPVVAVPEFSVSWPKGAVFMGSLLCSGAAAAAVAAALGGGRLWWLGGTVMIVQIPFTLALVMPISRQLLSPGLDPDVAVRLLTRWGRLHAARAVLGLTAFLIFLYNLVQGSSF